MEPNRTDDAKEKKPTRKAAAAPDCERDRVRKPRRAMVMARRREMKRRVISGEVGI